MTAECMTDRGLARPRVCIQVPGRPSKTFLFTPGETVAGVGKRVADFNFASNRVKAWWLANGADGPGYVAGETVLRHGMKLMGGPKTG